MSTAIADIIDYVENPQKTDYGRLITGYECDTRTADAEFVLSKRQYFNLTGRQRGADDVIAYHLRQAFKPGEVTPEEANEIGRELAMKLTKGNNAFVICTHIDKHHAHNHIIINSMNLDCTRKFRNFWGSTWAIRRMNDKLCMEHGLYEPFYVMEVDGGVSNTGKSAYYTAWTLTAPKMNAPTLDGNQLNLTLPEITGAANAGQGLIDGYRVTVTCSDGTKTEKFFPFKGFAKDQSLNVNDLKAKKSKLEDVTFSVTVCEYIDEGRDKYNFGPESGEVEPKQSEGLKDASYWIGTYDTVFTKIYADGGGNTAEETYSVYVAWDEDAGCLKVTSPQNTVMVDYDPETHTAYGNSPVNGEDMPVVVTFSEQNGKRHIHYQ